MVHGRWSMVLSMEGVQGVVHGRGPRGGPWTGGQCFQLSPKIGRSSNMGGGGQPFSSRNSLTDHKKHF